MPISSLKNIFFIGAYSNDKEKYSFIGANFNNKEKYFFIGANFNDKKNIIYWCYIPGSNFFFIKNLVLDI